MSFFMKRKFISALLAAAVIGTSVPVPASEVRVGELEVNTAYNVLSSSDSVLLEKASYSAGDVVQFSVTQSDAVVSAESTSGAVEVTALGNGEYMFFMPDSDVIVNAQAAATPVETSAPSLTKADAGVYVWSDALPMTAKQAETDLESDVVLSLFPGFPKAASVDSYMQRISAINDEQKAKENDLTFDIHDGLYTAANGDARIFVGGHYLAGGWITVVDSGVSHVYYADSEGLLVYGWAQSAAGYRYFDPSSYEMKTGFAVVDGLDHFFHENGIMAVDQGL